MAEPRVFYAQVGISQKGFREWLAMPIVAGQGAASRVIDCLTDYLVKACGIGTGNCLLCRYDKPAKQLHFALHLADGSTAASRHASADLQSILRSIIPCLPKNRKSASLLSDKLIMDWPAEGYEDSPEAPVWMTEWLENLPLEEDVLNQERWLDPEILKQLADIDLIATASPESPARIGWLYTDGTQVFANVAGKTLLTEDPASPDGQRMEFSESVIYVLEEAVPQKMRALADSYYTDGNVLWYCNIFSGNAPQALAYCNGNVPKAYHLPDADIGTLVTMGNQAWSEAYDDTKPPHERLYVKCTDIDGASFAKDSGRSYSFSDCLQHYRMDMRTGLQQDAGESDEG